MMADKVLSESDRAAHWEWCRAFLDHHCIFRSPHGNSLLVAPNGGMNSWQFYMQVATLDQEFGYRLGLLFWDQFLASFRERAFQLCGCESGAVPLLCSLQSAAYATGLTVNVFSIKKEAKQYGLHNWLEGVVL